MGLAWSPWQQMFFVAVVVATMYALVAGALAGLFFSWLAAAPFLRAVGSGIVVGALTFFVEAWYGRRAIARLDKHVKPLFPSPKA
jgi:hypothetical protein